MAGGSWGERRKIKKILSRDRETTLFFNIYIVFIINFTVLKL